MGTDSAPRRRFLKTVKGERVPGTTKTLAGTAAESSLVTAQREPTSSDTFLAAIISGINSTFFSLLRYKVFLEKRGTQHSGFGNALHGAKWPSTLTTLYSIFLRLDLTFSATL